MKPKNRDKRPDRYEAMVLDEAIAIEPGTWNAYRISVDLDRMMGCDISGSFSASGGIGNDIELLVFGTENYQEWELRMDGERPGEPKDVPALFRSGRVSEMEFSIPVPASDTYYLIFNNYFSNFSRKAIKVRVSLGYG